MAEFLKLSQRFGQFGLSQNDIQDAIKSACDFFNIPMPRMIQDLTYVQNGQTMFVNYDRGSYYDDVLCYNMQQLLELNVTTKEAFSLVMTHECAHRVLQAIQFQGINGGAWENELAADYLMGCRAGLWNMDDTKVVLGLAQTPGSQTHPEGTLRALFIRAGKYKAQEMHRQGIPLTMPNLINEFWKCRQSNLNEILTQQRKYFRF
jgi:hypothetical protein